MAKKRTSSNKRSRSRSSTEAYHIASISGSGSEDETELDLTEKRVRMAEEMLRSLGPRTGSASNLAAEDAPLETDAREIDRELIASRLKLDALQAKGRLYRRLAGNLNDLNFGHSKVLKGHERTPTCVAVSLDGRYVFSAGKDANVIQWDAETGRRLHVYRRQKFNPNQKGTAKKSAAKGHGKTVNCLAVNEKFLASAGKEGTIHIWDWKAFRHLACFTRHQGDIYGLSFQRGTNTLFSCGADRTVKIWNLDHLSYIDTLFGHQDSVMAVAALGKERCITAGGRDRTIRLWKIAEGTQLVFRQSQTSGDQVEMVAMIDEENFLSISEKGSIALWNINKKKPTFTYNEGHGISEVDGTPFGIISIATLPYSDLFATGSSDGFVRLWKVSEDMKKIMAITATIPIKGFVNGLAFVEDGGRLAVAVGTEHRLGRWTLENEANDVVILVNLGL